MPNIRHELFIGASGQKIYDAITGQKGLSAWWTPDVLAKHDVDSIARFGFGPVYFKEMKIAEVKPGQKVEWECVKGAEEWIGTKIFFELKEGKKEALLNEHSELSDQMNQHKKTNGTILMFRHDNWKEYTPMFAECNYTWGQFLQSLRLFCETGKGKPWPNQHQPV
jgi:uncharacterized protein YndB with AHSA1/START domain